MKKELVISIMIIILIIIGNIITQNYTNNTTIIISNLLDNLKIEVLAKDEKDNLLYRISTIEDQWNKFEEKLAYYIEHDELEKVETQIFTMKGFSEIKKYDEIIPELEKCIFILEHIQEKTKLNVKNIF